MSYSATLARVGGDEFACLLTEIGSGYSADSIAMACLQAGREPIDIDGKAHQLSLSIGISLYPQDAVNAEEMMRHADSAMYRSKSKGKDTFSFFSKDLQHAMHHRVEMEIKLRNAIENDSLAIYLQPKYNFDDSTVLSAESLVRMFDENGKVIGVHDGIINFTIGQRKGLGLGGPGEPYFVINKNIISQYKKPNSDKKFYFIERE